MNKTDSAMAVREGIKEHTPRSESKTLITYNWGNGMYSYTIVDQPDLTFSQWLKITGSILGVMLLLYLGVLMYYNAPQAAPTNYYYDYPDGTSVQITKEWIKENPGKLPEDIERIFARCK